MRLCFGLTPKLYILRGNLKTYIPAWGPINFAKSYEWKCSAKKKYIEKTLLATPEISYSNALAGFCMLKANDENITKNEEHWNVKKIFYLLKNHQEVREDFQKWYFTIYFHLTTVMVPHKVPIILPYESVLPQFMIINLF